jgi:hypothetical protein
MSSIGAFFGSGISTLLPTYWPGVGTDPGSQWDQAGEASNDQALGVVLGLLTGQGVPQTDQLAAVLDPAFLTRILAGGDSYQAPQTSSSKGTSSPPLGSSTQPASFTYTQFGTPSTADIAALGATLDLLDNNELPSDWQPPPTSLPQDQQLTNTSARTPTNSFVEATQAAEYSILGIALSSTAFDTLYA